MLLKILCLCLIIYVNAEKVRYDNYSLYKLYPQNKEHLEYLKTLSEENNGVQFWKLPTTVGDYASLIVSPKRKDELDESFKTRSVLYDVMIENIQEAIENQYPSRKNPGTRDLFWNGYQTLDDIYIWFQQLAEAHGNIVSVIHGGQSFEGRNITGVKIKRGSCNRIVLLDGGQIGADWISPTVVTYIVNQLVQGHDSEAVAATQDFEWHIFPVLNPDGYEYTQNVDRFWLKNRRPISTNVVGVDLTRNWNSQWGVYGGSFTSWANNFIGLGPFSEVETRSVSRYIESIGSKLVGHLSFRSFGQRVLVPFAHTTQPLYNYNEMMTIGRRAMGSLSVRYDTRYSVGTSMAVHDGSTGAMSDWVKFRFNPPVAATYLLRDEGAWGYILPVNQVLPTCEETYDSVMAVIREAKFINVL